MYNKAILIGRMVADPELKTTPNGVSVTSFRIAVDRAFAKERTADFFSITCWRQQAEFVCKYFAKGKPIGIEGEIRNREYTDKDGNKRTATEIVADRVFFVGGKETQVGAENAAQGDSGGSGDGFQMDDFGSDLPF